MLAHAFPFVEIAFLMMMWAMEQQATLKLLWKMTRNFWEWTPFLHQLITCKQCRGWKSLLEVWISSCKKYCSLSFHDSHVFSWYWPLNFKPYTCVGAQKVEENCIYISLSRMMKKYLEITSVPSNHVFPLKIQKLKNGMPLRVGYHICLIAEHRLLTFLLLMTYKSSIRWGLEISS
mgnify:CR=1 FL=1